MTIATQPALADWGNFYVIVGSSAGGLTGLMFVVIALGADAGAITSSRALRAFGTPTVVHFGAVLLLAALASTPGHDPSALGIGLGICGVVGLAYVAWITTEALRQRDYKPVTSDWVWHCAAPFVAYGVLAGSAIAMYRLHFDAALYMLASATMLLLYTGIHNAWDTAIWLATTARQRNKD